MELILNKIEFLKLKKRKKLKMAELAVRLGISRSQLWRVMNKQCSPGQQFIAGFKRAFPEENLDTFFMLNVLHKGDTCVAKQQV